MPNSETAAPAADRCCPEGAGCDPRRRWTFTSGCLQFPELGAGEEREAGRGLRDSSGLEPSTPELETLQAWRPGFSASASRQVRQEEAGREFRGGRASAAAASVPRWGLKPLGLLASAAVPAAATAGLGKEAYPERAEEEEGRRGGAGDGGWSPRLARRASTSLRRRRPSSRPGSGRTCNWG